MMPIGQKIKMYYDPRGNVIRTVNPDNSEQWVIHGKPNSLDTVEIKNSWSFKNYTPTPWESYTYDANDLAIKTNGTSFGHDFTPKSAVVDALGRTVKTTDRLSQNSADDVVMKYEFDIKANVTKITDPLDRTVFTHQYDLANRTTHTYHMDSANKQTVFDALGKPIELKDEKGSVMLSEFDVLHRMKLTWAKDKAADTFSVRQVVVYGDNTQGPANPETTNHLGKPYKNYDEAGLSSITEYDFKGNVITGKKQVIKDSLLLDAINDGVNNNWDVTPYRIDWTTTPWNEEINLLEGNYRTDIKFDALNRAIETEYPADINGVRKKIVPTYNRAGALERVTFDAAEYIEHIAYNAKGQKLLIAFGNGLMTRHTYDKKTFRLKRTRTSGFTKTSWTFTDNAGVKEDKLLNYDFAGNILSTTDKVTDCGLTATPDTMTRNFNYDALSRLLSATGRESNTQPPSDVWLDVPAPGTPNAQNCRFYSQQFEYDKLGNILLVSQTASGNNWTRRYNYNANSNTLQSIDDNHTIPTTIAEFIYDVNGNQTKCNTEKHYEWDFADRMKAFYNQTGTGAEPTLYAVYLYDTGGNRAKKLVRKQSGTWESVTYVDGAFEYHKQGVEEKNYTHVAGDVEIKTGSYSDDSSDDIIYQMKDHVGSVGLRINQSGTTIDREEFYPFGDASLRTFSKKRYRYCGREKDEESGLYYYGARYYASWMCRFLSVDPLAIKYAQLTPYNYAGNEPVGDLDIDGQQSTNTSQSENAGGNSSQNQSGISSTGNTTNNSGTADNVKTYSIVIDVNFENINGKQVDYGGTTTYNDEKGASGVLIRAHNLKTGETTEQVQMSGDVVVKPQKTFGEKANEVYENVNSAMEKPFIAFGTMLENTVGKALNKFSKETKQGGLTGNVKGSVGPYGLEVKVDFFGTSETNGAVNFELNFLQDYSAKGEKNKVSTTVNPKEFTKPAKENPDKQQWKVSLSGDVSAYQSKAPALPEGFSVLDLSRTKITWDATGTVGFGGAAGLKTSVNSQGQYKAGVGFNLGTDSFKSSVKGGAVVKFSLFRWTSATYELGH